MDYGITHDKYDSDATHENVDSLMINLENKGKLKIILDADYQRDIVWGDEQMSCFINSVIKGIVPSAILFNREENGNRICMDGKQRLTSLMRFIKNEIPVTLEKEGNDGREEHTYYYERTPEDEKDDSIGILPENIKVEFLNRKIPIICYKYLSYVDQIDIFNRIQNGKPLEMGEIIPSIISDKKVNKELVELCEECKPFFKKFIKSNKITRKEHCRMIVELLMLYNEESMVNINKRSIERFAKDELTSELIKNFSEDVVPCMKIIFGDKILLHKDIKRKLNQNIIMAIIFNLYEIYYDKLETMKKQSDTIRQGIIKFVKYCKDKEIGIGKSEKILNRLQKDLKEYIKPFNDKKKKNKKITKDKTE